MCMKQLTESKGAAAIKKRVEAKGKKTEWQKSEQMQFTKSQLYTKNFGKD